MAWVSDGSTLALVLAGLTALLAAPALAALSPAMRAAPMVTALTKVAEGIDRTNIALGHSVAFAVLAMVLVQLLIVVLRYVFGIGSVWLQEAIIYLHASVFMAGAGYVLLRDGHVRVDIFYREASPERRALIDAAGSFLLVIPFAILVMIVGFPYVAASWAVWEGSKEASGLPFVYIQKSLLLVFAVSVLAQGWATGTRAVLVLAGVLAPDQVFPDHGSDTDEEIHL